MERTYYACRVGGVTAVTVNNKPLDPRLDVFKISDGAFGWGSGSNEAVQLAFAILLDSLGDENSAKELCYSFRSQVLSTFGSDMWTITRTDVLELVKSLHH